MSRHAIDRHASAWRHGSCAEGGEAIRDLEISYVVHGTRSRGDDNVILVLTRSARVAGRDGAALLSCFLTAANRRITFAQRLSKRKEFWEEVHDEIAERKEVAGYRERGYHFPVNALSDSEVTEFRGKLEDYEAKTGGPDQGRNAPPQPRALHLDQRDDPPSRKYWMRSRICWGRISFAGTPVSSSRSRMIPASYPGIRMRPIGD